MKKIIFFSFLSNSSNFFSNSSAVVTLALLLLSVITLTKIGRMSAVRIGGDMGEEKNVFIVLRTLFNQISEVMLKVAGGTIKSKKEKSSTACRTEIQLTSTVVLVL